MQKIPDQYILILLDFPVIFFNASIINIVGVQASEVLKNPEAFFIFFRPDRLFFMK